MSLPFYERNTGKTAQQNHLSGSILRNFTRPGKNLFASGIAQYRNRKRTYPGLPDEAYTLREHISGVNCIAIGDETLYGPRACIVKV
jgi:hypothetical protein